MTTLIFGRGFLGTRHARDLPDSYLSDVDITDAAAVARELAARKPSAVVNAAGKTGKPNVDWCESHPIETYRGNVTGPLVLAEACSKAGVYLLHLASGCIFYGDSPSPGGWREDDFANPVAFYSRTKYAADLVLAPLPNVGIARLRMPIDAEPGSRNLITKLAAYKQVVDVENSVTIVSDLVMVVAALIDKRGQGIFHVTNPGAMRHQTLLALYKELVDPDHTYELLRETELVSRGLAVRARSNCILASPRLAALGIAMRPVETALRTTMLEYAKHRRA
jgi:3,5-epimerase/4-reductase